jgi:hypothetical protein
MERVGSTLLRSLRVIYGTPICIQNTIQTGFVEAANEGQKVNCRSDIPAREWSFSMRRQSNPTITPSTPASSPNLGLNPACFGKRGGGWIAAIQRHRDRQF